MKSLVDIPQGDLAILAASDQQISPRRELDSVDALRMILQNGEFFAVLPREYPRAMVPTSTCEDGLVMAQLQRVDAAVRDLHRI